MSTADKLRKNAGGLCPAFPRLQRETSDCELWTVAIARILRAWRVPA